MKSYLRLFLISLTAVTVLNVPFLIYHQLPWFDVCVLAISITAFGLLAASRYEQRARLTGSVSDEWRLYFTIFPATFLVILHAILVSAARYQESGILIPMTTDHIVIISAGLAAFIISIFLPARIVRRTRSLKPAQSSPPSSVNSRDLTASRDTS